MATKIDFMSMMAKDEANVQCTNVVAKERVYLPSPTLNWALPIYRGYTTCLYGPEGSGKSLISMMALGALQQADPEAIGVIVSTEMRESLPERVRTLGVDPKRTLFRSRNTLHDVFDWIDSTDEKFKNSDGSGGAPGLRFFLEQGVPIKGLIIDSIKGIQGPREQAADSVEKDLMGDISKFLNPSLRLILPIIRKYNLMTLLVQQVNMNMNADEVKYQNRKWIVPSGQALKHFCESMALIERVESKDAKIFSDTAQIRDKKALQLGHTIRVKVEKANLDAPFRESQFRLDYMKGVVQPGLEVFELGSNLGVITHPINPKSGLEIVTQWEFGGQKWIGERAMVEALEGNPSLREDIMKAMDHVSDDALKAKFGSGSMIDGVEDTQPGKKD